MDVLSSDLPRPEDSRDVAHYPDIGEALKSSVGHLCAPLERLQESTDSRVVVMFDAKTRVIAADIQWILQKRRGKEWRGEMFFRSKEGLLLYAPKPTAPELLALPDWFPEFFFLAARTFASPQTFTQKKTPEVGGIHAHSFD